MGIENILPEMDDDKGTSLILVHSPRGLEMLGKISPNMKFKEVDAKEAVKHNTAAIESVEAHPKRSEFFERLGKVDFEKLAGEMLLIGFVTKGARFTKRVVKHIIRRTGFMR